MVDLGSARVLASARGDPRQERRDTAGSRRSSEHGGDHGHPRGRAGHVRGLRSTRQACPNATLDRRTASVMKKLLLPGRNQIPLLRAVPPAAAPAQADQVRLAEGAEGSRSGSDARRVPRVHERLLCARACAADRGRCRPVYACPDRPPPPPELDELTSWMNALQRGRDEVGLGQDRRKAPRASPLVLGNATARSWRPQLHHQSIKRDARLPKTRLLRP